MIHLKKLKKTFGFQYSGNETLKFVVGFILNYMFFKKVGFMKLEVYPSPRLLKV